jgi:hypothetical protein
MTFFIKTDMRFCTRVCCIALVVSMNLCLTDTNGQISGLPKYYICYRTDTSLMIDGRETEKIWKAVPWTNNFCDIRGCDQPEPRFRTRAKLLWNDQYLYILAQLYEPDIWANLRQRDTIIYHDNDFEVFVDPDGDTHHYYEFEINALNTPWDLLLTKPYRDGGTYVSSWDYEGLQTAVYLSGTLNNPTDKDTCWTVEMAFPFTSYSDSGVHIPPKPGDQWRVNFSRVEWQTVVKNGRYVKVKDTITGKILPEDNWVWSPQGAIDMHRPERWGFLQFSGHVGGAKSEEFHLNPDEPLKLQLRDLYYLQKKFLTDNKRFAQTTQELKNTGTSQCNFDFSVFPSIQGYEITARRPGSSHIWHINATGRIWATKSK